MRIVTGGISQETNTFQWEPTALSDFGKGASRIRRGDQIRELAGTPTIYGGILGEAERQGVELVLTTYGNAAPGGRVTRDAFESMEKEILDGIRAALPVDGVILGLHGAMALEHADDGEGLLLKSVRELGGPDIPIAAPLDLHGNLSSEMMQLCDIFVGYKEYPHIDMAETGAQVTELLIGMLNGELKPSMAYVKVPLIVANQAMVTTWQSPLKIAIDRAREMEAEDGIEAATVLGGFPFSDSPHTSISIIVVANNNPEKATLYAGELAQICWDARVEFEVVPTPPQEAIAEAMAGATGSTYILADVSDSGASGTAGDGTVILDQLLKANARSAVVAQIMDKEAVEACVAAGAGETVTR